MEYTDYLLLLGRILYGGYFVMAGLNHFMQRAAMQGYAASKRVPMPAFLVPLSGLFIVLGGLGVLLGAYVDWAVFLIVIFLAIVSFQMHNFWADTDPNAKMANMINFQKNMALLGAALMFLAIPEPWMWSVM